MTKPVELTILMPCLNEVETLGTCIRKCAKGDRCAGRVSGEVVVADNGSKDGSVQVAEKAGARVVHVKEKGYGRGCAVGLKRLKPSGSSWAMLMTDTVFPALKDSCRNFVRIMIW